MPPLPYPTPMRKGSRMVPVRTRDEYVALSRARDAPLLLQMEAPWCGDCHHALPELEAVAERYGDRLTVMRLNADADPRLREEFGLQGYPTYVFVENERVTASCLGAPEFGLTRLVEIIVP